LKNIRVGSGGREVNKISWPSSSRMPIGIYNSTLGMYNCVNVALELEEKYKPMYTQRLATTLLQVRWWDIQANEKKISIFLDHYFLVFFFVELVLS
jgi:hypothetical protein